MIKQAYISKSVSDFPFLEKLNLTEYNDPNAPALFIGCYTYDDINAIRNHNSKVTVFWCGQDALACIQMGWSRYLQNCTHVTHLINVERALKPFLIIKLVSPISLGGSFEPTPFGAKVYAYVPNTFQEYHGSEIINELISYYKDQFEFILGVGNVPMNEWLSGKGDEFYNECFIGLCLSGFAGGGQTVLHLGMKGRLCVNNIIDSPNSNRWNTIEDIKKVIESESKLIGQTSDGMAKLVNAHVNKTPTWL